MYVNINRNLRARINQAPTKELKMLGAICEPCFLCATVWHVESYFSSFSSILPSSVFLPLLYFPSYCIWNLAWIMNKIPTQLEGEHMLKGPLFLHIVFYYSGLATLTHALPGSVSVIDVRSILIPRWH